MHEIIAKVIELKDKHVTLLETLAEVEELTTHSFEDIVYEVRKDKVFRNMLYRECEEKGLMRCGL